MDSKPLGSRFMGFISQVLKAMKFEVAIYSEPMMRDVYCPDLAIKGGSVKGLIETKFYRSRQVSNHVIITAATKLAAYEYTHQQHLVLIVSSIVSASLKNDILDKFGVVIWDRSNLAAFLASLPAR
ncbi:hypothetical protein [Pedobacter panaciterrae]